MNNKKSEFEDEYDNRYEGLDFDDVDDHPRALDDVSDGEHREVRCDLSVTTQSMTNSWPSGKESESC